MQALVLILSLLAVTQLTLAFVTGVGQGDQDVGLGADDVTTVPMTTGYSFATDFTEKAFSDAIEAASTPLIMQTNNEDRESSDFPEHDTEQSASPSEVVKYEDGGVTEQSLEVVTNDSTLVTEEHESTDSSSGEMDTNAATIEEDAQLATEEVDGSATAGSDSNASIGESAQPEGQSEDEEGTKKAAEEGQEGKTEGEEETLASQATDGDDQLLTTLAVDMETTGESQNQATEKEASPSPDLEITSETPIDITSTVEPEYQDGHSETPSEAPSSQAATFDLETEKTLTIEEKGSIEGKASDFVGVEDKLQSEEVHEPDNGMTSDTLSLESEQSTTTDSTVDRSTVEGVASDFIDVEDKLQGGSDSEMASEAPSLEPEQSTITHSTVDGSTVEGELIDARGMKSVDAEEILEEKVESVGTEEVIAEVTTEMATTTVEVDDFITEEATAGISDSRVATVKTHATTSDKAHQRGALSFQSLRMHIFQGLHGVKNSIYQAATSLRKAVEDLQDVMVSFIDGINVHPRRGIPSDLPDGEPMETRETALGPVKGE
ncbi:unnamed protein product [Taenia asiatica]|uniref:DUF148 domain-containing protein n=1 Tax=Taenia asiatica TaxID=60517 RepID=A0A0R3WBI8_TAEAS|nr:unnamed protein product [Taenia asiatica]